MKGGSSVLRDLGIALLLAALAGECGKATLTARDADVPRVDGAGGTAGDGGAADAIGSNDAGGFNDAGGSNDVGGSSDAPSDGRDSAPPVNDSWIYVVTPSGVERVKAAGGAFTPFGVVAPTKSVSPSPNGQLVAQELVDERVAVFDASNSSVGSAFDIRTGLLGWSDDSTLLFFDWVTASLVQTSVDGQMRQQLTVPPSLGLSGYTTATLSPDRTLVLVASQPVASATGTGPHLAVLSAANGVLVDDIGVLTQGGATWTGDGRLLMRSPSGTGLVALSPRSGTSTSVPSSPALDTANCGVITSYQAGKVVLAKVVFLNGSDLGTCIAFATFDVDSGATSNEALAVPASNSNGLNPVPFAQSADETLAAVGLGAMLELGTVAGGTRAPVGMASGSILNVGWAHPTGGVATLVVPTKPPSSADGLAGAPSVASRSGGTDCSTGRWVNRTPSPLPAGWPRSRSGFGFAFDSDRGTLLVDGGVIPTPGGPLNLDYETMQWDGASAQWTNYSRPDGFGPVGDRSLAYDTRHHVILALGDDVPYDGPWTWTPDAGWKNLRFSGLVGARPFQSSGATSVYDLSRDRWIVSGGWEWDGAAWQQSTAPPPGGTTQLAGARLVYDSKRGHVYSVGNRDRGPSPWLYDPTQNQWTAQPSSGPSPLPRDWAGVAYDTRRDRVMVFAGYVLANGSGGTVGDLAEWDPASGAWQQCPTTGDAPGARMKVAMAYDPTRDVLVLYGGDSGSGTTSTDVWEWYVP
jgi:hypothetical protein